MPHYPRRSLDSPFAGGAAFDVQRPAVAERGGAYGPVFWAAYIANALTMIAITLLVRYADFVTHLGGAEGQLGLIVGVGMIGSLCMRVGQGVGIDRYGPRLIWRWSMVFFIVSLVAHLWITSATSFEIFAIRILMQTSIAGIFGASITYISRRVPPDRMAEIIGTLGTSGFVGFLVGPQLGDWICRGSVIEREQLNWLFLTAAGLATGGLVAVYWATRGETIKSSRRQPPVLPLVRRYNPGFVLLVAVVVGGGITIPHTFLRTFAAERNISQIGFFFIVYACTAFVARMMARGLYAKYGNRPWIVAGLALLAISMGLYLVVHQVWQLAIPAVFAGAGHAILFPAIMAAGSTRFPERYRGLGTTLMLSMYDIGNLIGAPVVGGTLHLARLAGLPAYTVMFTGVAGSIGIMAAAYWWRTRKPAPNATYFAPRSGERFGASRRFFKEFKPSLTIVEPAASAIPLKVSGVEPAPSIAMRATVTEEVKDRDVAEPSACGQTAMTDR
ncbi:MAG TPA: MFS transporter [Pirellulaceae bacterium]|nr:MFS transporter [Pirellulaceae bacterium]